MTAAIMGRRLRRLGLLILLGACTAHGPAGDGGPRIALSLANTGSEPLHCRLMFGHWVERDLGVLQPGAGTSLDIWQQPGDGALYVMRPDGKRRMMIENIICGRDAAWQESVAQVDLMPVRMGRPARVVAGCAAEGAAGRVICPPVRLDP